MDERRNNARYVAAEVTGISAVRVRPGIEATLIDLGAGGLALETDRRLLPGRFVHVQLIDRGGTTTLRARVLRTDVVRLTAMVVIYRCAVVFDQPYSAFTVAEGLDAASASAATA